MAIDRKFIGKSWPHVKYEVCREKIREYALAIKDPDPHYIDEEFAKKTVYGDIIAPPTFAAVFGVKLMEMVFSDKELNLNVAMLVHGEQDYEFYEVVKAGDRLTTHSRIVDIRIKEKLDIFSVELLTENQHGRNVCRGIYTFVVRK